MRSMVDVKVLNDFSNDLMFVLDSYKNKNAFSLDITTTENCNFKCSYCFEGDKVLRRRTYNLSDMTNFIEKLMSNEIFMNEYKMLTLNFWGGEPTIEVEDIIHYISTFHDNPCVNYFIYTNGTLRQNIDSIVECCKKYDCLDKLTLQISWDGEPVHDKHRISNNRLYNSDYVQTQIERYVNMGVQVDLKATLLPQDFSKLPEIWDSYYRLNKRLNTDFSYVPTIDQTYYGNKYLKEFEEAISEICVKEINHIHEYGHTLLHWFGRESHTCSYRSNMLCVDVLGDIYPCHGFLYEDESAKSCELLGNIKDITFIDDYMNNVYRYPIPEEPEVCKNCEATYCVSCCVKNSVKSKKETSYERWFDRQLTDRCDYFKIFGIYDKALHRLIIKNIGVHNEI